MIKHGKDRQPMVNPSHNRILKLLSRHSLYILQLETD
jgi:hypothetical protein